MAIWSWLVLTVVANRTQSASLSQMSAALKTPSSQPCDCTIEPFAGSCSQRMRRRASSNCSRVRPGHSN